MNRHLSAEQISNMLIGEADLEASRHARECGVCDREVFRLEKALGIFRGAVIQMSERTPEPTRFLTLKSGSYRSRETAAGLYSLLFHGAAIAGMLAIATMQPVRNGLDKTLKSLPLVLKPYLPEKQAAHGGGGGGTKSLMEAERGKLPKPAVRQFVPPRVDPPENAKLTMTPTIIADAAIPNIDANNLGDPLSHLGVPSNGPGLGGGIGSGIGTGVGVGHGPGAGDGRDGGFGAGAFSIGGGVVAPSVLLQVEPEYSEEARKARFQGSVLLEIVVDEHGNPRQMRVLRALGMGLDEKAIEAVAKWKFKPGMKGGKPVPVVATVQVNFRLL